eukprot:m.26132 g.26132  ORF g.26132 m.26132 type:complete len:458 (+) comp6278_c0_seq1:243-1616(+)
MALTGFGRWWLVPVAAIVVALPSGVAATFQVAFNTFRDIGAPFVEVGVTGAAASGLVIFDTGSPLFWLSSTTLPRVSAPESERQTCPNQFLLPSTAVSLGQSTSFAYGRGYIAGPEFKVGLELAAERQRQIVATSNVTVIRATSVGMSCMVGILGMDQGSLTAPKIFAQHNLESRFTVTLNCPGRPGRFLPAGHVLFGGANSTAVVNGEFSSVPLLSTDPSQRLHPSTANPQGVTPNYTLWWQVGVRSVSVGTVTQQTVGMQAIVDTGTSVIAAGPSNPIIAHCAVAPDCRNYSALRDIRVVFNNGVVVTLGPAHYVRRDSSTSCISLVQTLDDVPSDFIVLGVPFFWKYDVIFDYVGSGQMLFGERLSSGECQRVPGPGGAPQKKLSAGAAVGIFLAVFVIVLVGVMMVCFTYHDKKAITYMTFQEPLDPVATPTASPTVEPSEPTVDYAAGSSTA